MTSKGSRVDYRVVVFGSGGVGKTALTIMFTHSHFVEDYNPTIEDSFQKLIVVDEEACLVDILDTAGQDEYTAMRDQYIRCDSSACFIIVFDVTKRSTFEDVETFAQLIFRVKEATFVPMIIVGNKCDLEDERQVTSKEARDLAAVLNASYIETSAKKCVGIQEVFVESVHKIRILRRKMRGEKDESTVTSSDTTNDSKIKKILKKFRSGNSNNNTQASSCSLL